MTPPPWEYVKAYLDKINKDNNLGDAVGIQAKYSNTKRYLESLGFDKKLNASIKSNEANQFFNFAKDKLGLSKPVLNAMEEWVFNPTPAQTGAKPGPGESKKGKEVEETHVPAPSEVAESNLKTKAKAIAHISNEEQVKKLTDELKKTQEKIAKMEYAMIKEKDNAKTKSINGKPQNRKQPHKYHETDILDMDPIAAEALLAARAEADIINQDEADRLIIAEPDQLPEVNVVNEANTPPILIAQPMIIPMQNAPVVNLPANPTRQPVPAFGISTFGQPGTLQMNTLKPNKTDLQFIKDDVETIKNIDLLTPEGQIYMKRKFLEQKQIFDWIADITPKIPIKTYKAVEQDQITHNADKYLISTNQRRWLEYSNSIPKNQRLYPA